MVKKKKLELKFFRIENEEIIDIFVHSDQYIFLCKSGNLYSHNETQKRMIKSKKMDMIVSFKGRIYGLKNNAIYVLENFKKNNWNWVLCDWTPGNMNHISVTKDYKFLILQNSDTIKIFSEENVLYDSFNKGQYIRKYDDINNYVDFYSEENFYDYKNNKFYGIKDLEIYKGKIYEVKETDDYNHIRICFSEPFYF